MSNAVKRSHREAIVAQGVGLLVIAASLYWQPPKVPPVAPDRPHGPSPTTIIDTVGYSGVWIIPLVIIGVALCILPMLGHKGSLFWTFVGSLAFFMAYGVASAGVAFINDSGYTIVGFCIIGAASAWRAITYTSADEDEVS